MTTVALSFFLVIAQDSGLPEMEAGKQGSAEIVKKDSHLVLSRHKREWIWNSLYVEEENNISEPSKIGQLKSSQKLEVKRFSIEGEGANDIFLVENTGDLFVTRKLDREQKSTYKLTAKMYDGNNKLIEDAGHFEVQVTDINDNSPEFPSKSYNESIAERCTPGTKIVQMRATDADDPTTANADLRYTLTGHGETSAFKIDSITGIISCKTNTLDRETKSQYVVVVQAQDMRGLHTGSTGTTSVTINIADINDNMASFTTATYNIKVKEDHNLNEKINILELRDKDEIQNKQPIFAILGDSSQTFDVGLTDQKDGYLMLKKHLDFETKNSYSFTVQVREDLRLNPDMDKDAITKATVNVIVEDVDEPPVFPHSIYNFTVIEEENVSNIGSVVAKDPDAAKSKIRYSILDQHSPIGIHEHSGQLYTLRKLDRELKAKHVFQVKAQEEQSGLESSVYVNINVKDINDNPPELVADDIYVCESDNANTVIGILKAADKDEQQASFTFSMASESSNFTIRDYGNNSAAILVTQGPFSMDDPKDYSVDVRIRDGGKPILTSITKLRIRMCWCDPGRIHTHCKPETQKMGVSVHALIAILLCILTILVIVILFVMRKRYQKDSLASMKNSGEIHEQLVTYDEEGGGEMDTNGYDVSILTSACNDGSMLRHPDRHPHPSLYAMVQKPPHHAQPSACKGDMAAMIEEKKDEADHDRDGFPYDTLHIYGYEGPESLAGSLSSLESSSTGSNLDYDFLNDWGPRFRTLAELYGVDGPEYYHQY